MKQYDLIHEITDNLYLVILIKLIQNGKVRRYRNVSADQMAVSNGAPRKCVINSAKYGWPFRADTKMDVVRIINDIEVDDESKTPFLDMRYPLEDGNLHQEYQAKRVTWFMSMFGLEKPIAAKLAEDEFTALFSTKNEMVDIADPNNIIGRLNELDLTFSSSDEKEILKETKSFFAKTQKALIKITPMKTYPKSKYHFGMKIGALQDKEWPEAVSFWTANGENLSNVITQCNLPGKFSFEDEQRIAQAERSFMMVASEHGAAAHILRQDHARGFTDFLQHRMENPEGQSRPERNPNRPIRPNVHRGRYSTDSDSMPELEPDQSDEASDDVISTDNETIIGPEYNQPRLSLNPKDALPPPTVSHKNINTHIIMFGLYKPNFYCILKLQRLRFCLAIDLNSGVINSDIGS